MKKELNGEIPHSPRITHPVEAVTADRLKYVKLPLRFEAELLQQDLEKVLPSEWIPHYNERDYEGEWQIASLRSVAGGAEYIYSSTIPDIFRDTALMQRCSYTRDVVGSLKCVKMAVRYMKLEPGSVIQEHADSALSVREGEARLHIPVQTNPGVEFRLDNELVLLKEGECWYMDFTLMHSVRNSGASPRVHLVLDCKLNDWLLELLTGSHDVNMPV